ncbi:hypothetical protein QCA50_018236 [Cerrena zonata]|uniref:Uncharacterized protein n=1 Tax=Cerrena zonata TaxID=2478898 RepID=A0AAW0FIC5_9APHY
MMDKVLCPYSSASLLLNIIQFLSGKLIRGIPIILNAGFDHPFLGGVLGLLGSTGAAGFSGGTSPFLGFSDILLTQVMLKTTR